MSNLYPQQTGATVNTTRMAAGIPLPMSAQNTGTFSQMGRTAAGIPLPMSPQATGFSEMGRTAAGVPLPMSPQGTGAGGGSRHWSVSFVAEPHRQERPRSYDVSSDRNLALPTRRQRAHGPCRAGIPRRGGWEAHYQWVQCASTCPNPPISMRSIRERTSGSEGDDEV